MQPKRSWIAAAAAGLVALAIPTSAGAATQLGQTFDPNGNCGGVTVVQVFSADSSYEVPSRGVITSWAFQADASPPPFLKLKVARPEGGNVFTVMGESAAETPGPNAVSTYPARIPVNAGEVLGYFSPLVGVACLGTTAFDIVRYIVGDQPPGTTGAFPYIVAAKLDISAILEPDCDADGFGDETQDPDLSSCDPNAPQATITRRPPDKTKKKRATFEFAGTDTRAVASFRCSLDGTPFASCTSPFSAKVKKGKHTFAVQAVDQAGNVGAPATDTWKRKKKKK